MQLLSGLSRVCLERDQLIALRDGTGARVTCLSGSLWLTQENAAEDQVLEAGQSVLIKHAGLTLIMALAPSSVRLADRTSHSRLWDRAFGWLQRDGLARSGAVSREYA
ncbi:MAG TPA: DUF2917 domain-containing protein [Burkholderiales bacterium]|nr:DUF2917 domain-containing protein [Burkholderiales bacterium]